MRTWMRLVGISMLLAVGACSDPGDDDTSTPGTPDLTPTDTPTTPDQPTDTPVTSAPPTDTPIDTPIETPTSGVTSTPDITPTASPGITPTPTVTPPTSTPEPSPTPVDYDGDGVPEEEDCDDGDPERYPGNLEEPYDGIDQDCDGQDLTDVDQDGYDALEADGTDCDDEDINTYPGAPEFADGADNDCDGVVDNHLDSSDDDGDGYSEVDGDCRDDDPDFNPGATETCNALDDDCDSLVDDDDDSVTGQSAWYRDADADTYGDIASPTYTCAVAAPEGYVADDSDCDDDAEQVHPGATEICDGIDNDCDALIDDADPSVTGQKTYFRDADGDGYGSAGSTTTTCSSTPPSGYVADSGDCDDTAASVHPNATEVCDAADVDEDCDSLADDADPSVTGQNTWYRDSDGDGYGNVASSTKTCSSTPPSGYTSNASDCDDAAASVNPGAAEVCTAEGSVPLDDDCDALVDDADPSVAGQTTWYRDADGDGYGTASSTTQSCSSSAPSGYVGNASDCNDGSAAVNPGATEVCDASDVDEDCDGKADDADPSVTGQTTYYRDADADGYGSPASSMKTCATSAPSGYASNSTDCNDGNASVNPGATEVCDASDIDEDCDGNADDADPSVTGQTTYYRDADADGYGSLSSSTKTCASPAPSGYASSSTDCNDGNANVNPGATEVCDAADVDEDCDGKADDADPSVTGQTTYYRDADGDGYGTSTSTTKSCASTPPSGYVTNSDDCNDSNANIWGSCTSLPPQDGALVGYWRFEDPGTKVEDASAFNNDGVLYGAVTSVTGKVGKGYKMKDGACVTIPDSASLSMTAGKAVTYMAWINYTSPCNSDRGMILNKESTYEFGIYCATPDYLQEAVQLSDGNWFWTGGAAIARNTWVHVAVVWNGSDVRRYINGAQVESPRSLSGQFAERETGLGIGCRGVSANGASVSGSYFNGTVDEVAVYSRALSASELSSYYTATK